MKIKSFSREFARWHVAVAAEAIAAGLFARCGCDVSVQYGANQPEYDLMIAKGARLLKVSVKGSQDGAWGLCQSHFKRGEGDYHGAIDHWVLKHKPRTVLCLVQFQDVALTEMPRVYLATPWEVGQRLRDTKKGRGDTILWECHTWGPRAYAAGITDRIPKNWSFSCDRTEELLRVA